MMNDFYVIEETVKQRYRDLLKRAEEIRIANAMRSSTKVGRRGATGYALPMAFVAWLGRALVAIGRRLQEHSSHAGEAARCMLCGEPLRRPLDLR